MAMTQRSLQRLWLKGLLFTLFGYTFLGKGFGYLYVGEMVLLLGIFVFLQSGRFMVVFSDPLLVLYGMFAVWGVCRTLPFLSKYGFDAARDSVIWGYGLFVLLIVSFVNTRDQISRTFNTYRRFLKWYVPLLPVLLLLTLSLRDYVPKIPWGDHPGIVFLKTGDAGANLAAAAIFWMLFPDRPTGSQRAGISVFRLLQIAAWPIGALLICGTSRGGMLALLIPIAFVSVLKIQRVGWKVGAFAVVGIVFALLILETTSGAIHIKGRSVNPDQIVEMAGSIVGADSAATGHEGTAAWRLVWWNKIIHYTFLGPHFWTGKGFGVNLAVDDGVPELNGTSLRSPHNGNMTVLARTGVPGLVLWLALNATFVIRLFMAYRRAVRSGSRFWSGVNLWIFCYWLAMVLNLSFDVVLEGPPGGIWFWSIIGFGIASLRVQAYEARQMVADSPMRSGEDPNLVASLVYA